MSTPASCSTSITVSTTMMTRDALRKLKANVSARPVPTDRAPRCRLPIYNAEVSPRHGVQEGLQFLRGKPDRSRSVGCDDDDGGGR